MRYKKIILGLLAAGMVTFSSCQDQLDLNPHDGLTEEQVFSDVTGLENAIKGVYSAFRSTGYYGETRGLLIGPDILSDNLILSFEGRQTQQALYEMRNTANDEAFGLYFQGYVVASRANRILDNIGSIPDGMTKNSIEGEALALRAIAHFDLARTYAKIPTQSADAGASTGLYYATTFNPVVQPSRDLTVDQLYAKIVEDLVAAEAKVIEPSPNEANKYKGRLTKKAVAAILSRVYLYQGEYQKAADAADRAIASGAPVAPRESFGKVWVDEYDANVLFKIRFTDQDDIAIGNSYSQSSGGEIRSEYVSSFELFGKYKDSDIRKSTTLETSAFGAKMYNHVTKYLGRATGSQNIVDAKYIRMEEVYLNKAEALLSLPSPDEAAALEALDAVRANRYSAFASGNETGQALADAVQLERRLELAFEGDRFYTLKRRGEDIVRSATEGHLADGTGVPAVESARILKAGSFRWQLPIPQDALNQNANIEQNAGY